MSETHRAFQVFCKPVSSRCNLRCRYCYYIRNPVTGSQRMRDELLEAYILQHIQASTDRVITFSWHGGEPTLFGLEGFRRIVALQKRHCPADRRIANGIQTNGLLLNAAWCRFLAEENFTVGLSMDGPEPLHDLHRVRANGEPSHHLAMKAYGRLQKHRVQTECLCVVHAGNVDFPLEAYEFFRGIGTSYLTFLPLVEPPTNGRIGERTLPADAWGDFLCTVFDAWRDRDIGRVRIQIFEEALRPAFGLEHTLCIFRQVCGGVPALEGNGDLYSCDHFVTPAHLLGNIRETPLIGLLDSARQQDFGRRKWESLPQQCLRCAVLEMCNGGCPKNRFVQSSDGEPGLNYLCSGYKRFFTHCRPFVDTVSKLWRSGDWNYGKKPE